MHSVSRFDFNVPATATQVPDAPIFGIQKFDTPRAAQAALTPTAAAEQAELLRLYCGTDSGIVTVHPAPILPSSTQLASIAEDAISAVKSASESSPSLPPLLAADRGLTKEAREEQKSKPVATPPAAASAPHVSQQAPIKQLSSSDLLAAFETPAHYSVKPAKTKKPDGFTNIL
jgi:hypothetical protein